MKKLLILQALTIFSLSALQYHVPAAHGGIIFQESFDGQADWNLGGQYDGNECSVGNCAASMPPDWSFYRVMPGASGLSPVASIRRLPGDLADHTTTSGKALVIYNESVSGVNWPGDGILGKYLGPSVNLPELYVRLFFRTQTGWQVEDGAASKFFRVFHYDGSGNIFQFFSTGFSCPVFLWDLALYSGSAAYVNAYRCDPQGSDYYCGSSGNSYQQTDYFTRFPGDHSPTASGMYADTQWHQLDFHVKMSDPGVNNGAMEIWYDGELLESRTDVQWKSSSASASVGWNAFAVGGNSDNTWTSKGEQWYAIDDITVSTTPIPDDGGGSATAPVAPIHLKILTVN